MGVGPNPLPYLLRGVGGGLVEDLVWRIYGRSMEDLWSICGIYVEDMWKICGRYIAGMSVLAYKLNSAGCFLGGVCGGLLSV